MRHQRAARHASEYLDGTLRGRPARRFEAHLAGCSDCQRELAELRRTSEPLTAVAAYGRLDILFNNAAVQVFGTIPETSTSDWHRVLDVNLKGVYLGCKYALRQMIAQGGGCIVNMSSTLGLVGDPAMPAYGATKGGILAMTKAMAQAHGAAARCLEVGKGEDACNKELQAARKGLAIGKYCGMRHEH